MTAVTLRSLSQRNRRRSSERRMASLEKPLKSASMVSRTTRLAPMESMAWPRRTKRPSRSYSPLSSISPRSILTKSMTSSFLRCSASRSKPREATLLASSASVSSKARQTPGSPCWTAPLTRNSMAKRVLPQPAPPQTSAVRPRGRPPPVIWSKPSMPEEVLARARGGGAARASLAAVLRRGARRGLLGVGTVRLVLVEDCGYRWGRLNGCAATTRVIDARCLTSTARRLRGGGGVGGDDEADGGANADAAVDADAAAVGLDDAFGEGEAEADAAGLAGAAAVSAEEGLEQARLVGLVDADAAIGDGELEVVAEAADGEAHRGAGLGVAGGVGEQVVEHAPQHGSVAVEGDGTGVTVELEAVARVHAGEGRGGALGERAGVEHLVAQRQGRHVGVLAEVEARDGEDVLDQAIEVAPVVRDLAAAERRRHTGVE